MIQTIPYSAVIEPSISTANALNKTIDSHYHESTLNEIGSPYSDLESFITKSHQVGDKLLEFGTKQKSTSLQKIN